MNRLPGGITAWVVAIGAIALGVLAGRLIGDRAIRYGFEGLSGAGILIGGLVLVALTAAVVAAVLLAGVSVIVRRLGYGTFGDGRRLIPLALGCLALGALGGAVTAAATGGVYREPDVLQATGQIQSKVRSEGISDVTKADGPADCLSVPGSRTVSQVIALDLGQLGPATLRGQIGLDTNPSTAGTVSVSLYVEGAGVDEALPPTWGGAVPGASPVGDGSTGQISFEDLAFVIDPKVPAATRSPSWPASLSGTIRWTCNPWE